MKYLFFITFTLSFFISGFFLDKIFHYSQQLYQEMKISYHESLTSTQTEKQIRAICREEIKKESEKE